MKHDLFVRRHDIHSFYAGFTVIFSKISACERAEILLWISIALGSVFLGTSLTIDSAHDLLWGAPPAHTVLTYMIELLILTLSLIIPLKVICYSFGKIMFLISCGKYRVIKEYVSNPQHMDSDDKQLIFDVVKLSVRALDNNKNQ